MSLRSATRSFGPTLTVGLATLQLGAAALGWGRSGSRSRNSFELVGSARKLGVLDDGPAGVVGIWFMLPVLVGAMWLLLAARRPRIAVSAALLMSALVAVGAFAVSRSPLVAEVGVPVSFALAALAGCSAVATLAAGRGN